MVFSIERTTIDTNIPILARLHSDPAQPGHCIDEDLLEICRISGPSIHNGPGLGVCEEDLIRGEQAHPLLEILEVRIIKRIGRVWVHVDGYPGVHILWAHRLQLGRIILV